MNTTDGDTFFATLENALLLARRLSMPLSAAAAAAAAGKDKAKKNVRGNAKNNDKEEVREVNGMFIFRSIHHNNGYRYGVNRVNSRS
jgi:hypothetical protein